MSCTCAKMALLTVAAPFHAVCSSFLAWRRATEASAGSAQATMSELKTAGASF